MYIIFIYIYIIIIIIKSNLAITWVKEEAELIESFTHLGLRGERKSI